MQRYLDLSDKEKKEFYIDVDSGANIIGGDAWEPPQNRTNWDILELCKDCVNLAAAKTEYGSIHAKCGEFDCILRAGDPVIDCTHYKKVSFLSLDDMKEMAIILDPNKNKVGFIM